MPFPISCRACGATFNIPDDIYQRRVAGRVVNIRCKQCKADILVDGTQRQLGTEGTASRPPPAVSESSWPAAPQTPAEPEAQQRPEPVDARTNPDREQSSPGEQTTTPASRSEPSTAATGLDSETAASSPRAENSASQARAVGEAAVAPTADEPVRPPAPQTDEASRAAQSSASHQGSPHDGGSLARTEGAGVAGSAAVPQRPAPHAEETTLKEKDAASQQAQAGPATPRAAPSSQKQSEQQAPLGAPADLWAVSFGDDDDRELTETQIAEEARHGNLRSDMLVWRDGMESWLPLARVPELARLLPDEASSDRGNEAPSQTKASPAGPPPLARTTLGVGPVTVPQPVAAPDPEAGCADDQVPTTPVLPVERSPGASAAGEAAAPAPAPAAPNLAPPPVFGLGAAPSAPAPHQAVPSPFMDNVAADPARLQTATPMQSAPPARPSHPVSFDLEALPPVKRGRPVLWIAAVVVVVALGLVIGLMTSWTSPDLAVPSTVTPSRSTEPSPPATVGTVAGSPREPTQATRSVSTSTTAGRVDLFAPPGSAARAPARAAKSEPRKPSPRKPDLAEVFADKLKGKHPRR